MEEVGEVEEMKRLNTQSFHLNDRLKPRCNFQYTSKIFCPFRGSSDRSYFCNLHKGKESYFSHFHSVILPREIWIHILLFLPHWDKKSQYGFLYLYYISFGEVYKINYKLPKAIHNNLYHNKISTPTYHLDHYIEYDHIEPYHKFVFSAQKFFIKSDGIVSRVSRVDSTEGKKDIDMERDTERDWKIHRDKKLWINYKFSSMRIKVYIDRVLIKIFLTFSRNIILECLYREYILPLEDNGYPEPNVNKA